MDNGLKEQVKQATDIVALIGETVALKPVGDVYVGCCPFPHGFRNGQPVYDRRPSLTVYPQNQSYYCYGCGAGDGKAVHGGLGDVIGWVQNLYGYDFRSALAYLAERAGLEVPSAASPPPDLAEVVRQAEETTERNRRYYRHLLSSPAALAYLRQRGLDDDTIVLGRLGLVPPDDAGYLAGRLAIGVTDHLDGRLYTVGMAYRSLDGALPKYRNDPNSACFAKRHLLYLLPESLPAIKARRTVCLVEGYFDALLLHQRGIPYAVALMGKTLTPSQLSRLTGYVTRYILWLDGDYAGCSAMLRILPLLLATGREVQVIHTPDLDPDTVILATDDPADFLAARAQPALQWAIDYATADYRSQATAARLAAWELLEPLFAACSPAIRTVYADYARRALDINC